MRLALVNNIPFSRAGAHFASALPLRFALRRPFLEAPLRAGMHAKQKIMAFHPNNGTRAPHPNSTSRVAYVSIFVGKQPETCFFFIITKRKRSTKTKPPYHTVLLHFHHVHRDLFSGPAPQNILMRLYARFAKSKQKMPLGTGPTASPLYVQDHHHFTLL